MIHASRTRLVLGAGTLLVMAYRLPVGHASTQPAGAVHRFQQVATGVYSAMSTGVMETLSNSAIIVTGRDVIVVDSHATPASFRALLNEIKTITDKPVTTVINTHFHFDHTDGNQILSPGVEVVGHDFTRMKLLGPVLEEPTFADELAAQPRQVADLEAQVSAEQNAGTKAQLQQHLGMVREYWNGLKETRPVPPTITFSQSMTIVRGGREIRLHFFGRGHTGGDIIVYLPQERVVCSGDVLVNGVAFMGDAYVNEWPDELERMKSLDFETVIPGHGGPFNGKDRIGYFQTYLRDLWHQASTLHEQGVPAPDAAKRIDMTKHKVHFPSIQGPGVDPAEVARMYAVIDGRAEPVMVP